MSDTAATHKDDLDRKDIHLEFEQHFLPEKKYNNLSERFKSEYLKITLQATTAILRPDVSIKCYNWVNTVTHNVKRVGETFILQPLRSWMFCSM